MAICSSTIFTHAGRIGRILLVACFIPAGAFATTIIAVRTAEFAIIAADSKATYLGQMGLPTVCKIYNDGQLYFAVAGLDHDARRNFYVKNIVAQSFSPAVNFDDQVARIETAVSQSLLTELDHMQREDPGAYAFAMHSSREVVSIVLAEYRDSVPYLAARGFESIANPVRAIKIDRVTCPGDCSDGRELVLSLIHI